VGLYSAIVLGPERPVLNGTVASRVAQHACRAAPGRRRGCPPPTTSAGAYIWRMGRTSMAPWLAAGILAAYVTASSWSLQSST
jgi:hypothetical protein